VGDPLGPETIGSDEGDESCGAFLIRSFCAFGAEGDPEYLSPISEIWQQLDSLLINAPSDKPAQFGLQQIGLCIWLEASGTRDFSHAFG